MYSADGEYVAFTSRVKCIGPVEHWMSSIGIFFKIISIQLKLKSHVSSIEAIMRESLKYKLIHVLEALKKNLKTRDKWILKWPGQLCITASQVCIITLVSLKYLVSCIVIMFRFNGQLNVHWHCCNPTLLGIVSH